MAHFYRLRQEQHLSKAEALRQAQLILLRGGPPDSPDAPPLATADRGRPNRPDPAPDTLPAADYVPDPARQHAHPYYWAPFILMGNFR
jgi:CHAT domain-containing protein